MTGAATDLTDGDLETLRAGDLSEDLRARVYQELRHRRQAMERVERVIWQLATSKSDPDAMERWWAAELQSAVTGVAYLYRCPDHGDRRPLSKREERGVCCGEPFRGRLGVCTETAVLVGECSLP